MVSRIIALTLAVDLCFMFASTNTVQERAEDASYGEEQEANIIDCTDYLRKEIKITPIEYNECVEETVEEEPQKQEIDYDFEKVQKIVTHESGNDYELAKAVVMCIVNGCNKVGMNPEELCEEYQYAEPSNFISEAAKNACEDILLYGKKYDKVKDSLYFYSTIGGFYSRWHESQEFVAEINKVKFFK